MKKYLIALAVALMVCLVGMTASASEAENADFEAAMEEGEAVLHKAHEAIDKAYPNGVKKKIQRQIMAGVFEKAGWKVVFTSPDEAIVRDQIAPETMELAYKDINTASPEMKKKIIRAREVVMGNSSWDNDIDDPYCLGYVIDYNGKELIFPQLLSELFPGWAPPRAGILGGGYPEDLAGTVAEACSTLKALPVLALIA